MHISKLVTLDPQKNGGWRIGVRTEVGKRYKYTYPSNIESVVKKLVELKAGDCTTLKDLLELQRDMQSKVTGMEDVSAPSVDTKEKGIKKAERSAEKKNKGWSDKALSFIAKCPFHEFMTEDVRAWAHKNGLPLPPHPRAWGGVIARAKQKGMIVSIDYRPVKNKKAHRALATLWANVRLQQEAS